MPFVIPVGIDFADGVTLLPAQPNGVGTPLIVGTELPTANISFFSNYSNGTSELSPSDIQEPSGSPVIERAEQCTCQHTLKMSYVQAINYWTQMGRGVIVNDSAGNIWRILSCTVRRIEATLGELSYVMESISFDTPPDDFQINEVSLDLNIIKHPRYAWALNPYVTDASTYSLIGDTKFYYLEQKEAIIRMLQNYIDSPFFPNQVQTQGLIQTNILSALGFQKDASTVKLPIHYPNPNYNPALKTVSPVPWDGVTVNMPTANCVYFSLAVLVDLTNPNDPIAIAIAAASELLTKLWRQEDTPYIAGWEVIWTQYFFSPVYINPGGYIEDPRDWVPQYFISPFNDGIIPRSFPSGGFPDDESSPPSLGQATIFDQLTTYNPQCYATNGLSGGPLAMSCLRKSDHLIYERTFFGYPHTWLCAPVGKWDKDIYTQNDGPQDANDYNQLPASFG